MNIAEIENELIEQFSIFDLWDDKYQYLIDMAKALPILDEKYKTPDRLIKGCQSQVWLHTELINGKIIFHADSDAIITKGIVALLLKVFSGHAPKEIIEAQLNFINKIGLAEHLSPTRANGLVAMIKQMKMDAFVMQSNSTMK
ncbi:MAG: SufE family protein [Bacteroidetes bacterium]|nr:SufE family protein [Bacteroidota bacterium]PHX82876.1 MAG: Fe-S metabolism protein SufE [Flavobacteriales bacterium]